MAAQISNHRRSRRYNVKNFEAYCSQGGIFSFLGGDKNAARMPVVNFSLSGAQFLSAREFRNGERLRIRMSGAMQPEPVEVEAQVAWCRQVPRRSAYRVGVSFVAPKSGASQRLSQIEARIADLTIRLLCPGCGAVFAIKKRFEGDAGRCPRCKAPIEVHDEEVLPDLPEEKRVAEVEKLEKRESGTARIAPGVSRGLVRFIRTTLPSRLHMQMVQHFAKRPAGQVAGVSELSMILTVPEPRILAVCRELTTRGVLKEMGVKTYNYDPVPDAKRFIAEMASIMANPQKRPEILALVLDAEKRSG